MNENVLNAMVRNVLDAWYLDLEYLVNLIDKQNLSFDEIYENVEMNFWKECININYFIYEALSQVAYKFIEANQKLCNAKSDEFEIYTNYMDSHIWFTNEELQSKFEGYF